MLSDSYLKAGLDAMVRAFSTVSKAEDAFFDAHRAAGMISAWLLAQEGLVEERAVQIIARALDSEWMGTPLFAPWPAGEPIAAADMPAEFDALVAAIAPRFTRNCDPHPVIFPSLVFKTLRRHPAGIGRGHLDGLHRMTKLYVEQMRQETAGRAPTEAADAPNPDPAWRTGTGFDAECFCTWALTAFADSISGYVGNAPHLVGHILTYSAAVLDLQELGYVGLARKAEVALGNHITYAAPPKPWPVIVPPDVRRSTKRDSRPQEASFWAEHPAGFLEGSLAHAVKYPYGYLRLLQKTTNARLKERLASCAYVMLDWYLPSGTVAG